MLPLLWRQEPVPVNTGTPPLLAKVLRQPCPCRSANAAQSCYTARMGTLCYGDNLDLLTRIFSVKGGHLKLDDVRALDSVVTKNGASIGVLTSIGEPTRPMREWAEKWHSCVIS